MISFDEKTHTYAVDNKIVPSATQIIQEFFPMDPNIPQHYVEAAGLKGKALHKTLELHDKGILKEYDPQFEVYIKEWDKWKKTKKAKIERIEHLLAYDQKFAGTLDRIVSYEDEIGKHYLIIDFKTSSYLATAPIQLHAYEQLAFTDQGAKVDFGMLILQMRDDKLKEIPVPYDQTTNDTWTGMVNIWHFKRDNGFVKESW